MKKSLFSFQGKVWLAERSSAAKPLKPIWYGNASQLQIQMNVANTDKTESFSGNRLLYGQLAGAKTANVSLTLDEWSIMGLAMAMYGLEITAAGSTVTGEALPTPLAAGDVVVLEHGFIDDLVIDNGGTPLVLDTDYRIESPNAGLIEFLTPQATPLEADYEYAATESLTIFTQQPKERWLLFDGINTENNEPVLIDLYRLKLNPPGDLNLIQDDYGSLPLTGAVLYDPVNAREANFGGFGRIRQKG